MPKVYHGAKKRCSVCPIYWRCGESQYQQIKADYYQFTFQEEPCGLSEVFLLRENTHSSEVADGDGVKNTIVTPVGLDLDLLYVDYKVTSVVDLKEKYGYCEADKVLLFIGRMIDEKQPVRMIDILSELRKKDASYKLLMVGTGELKNAVEARIEKLDLEDAVQLVERIPNSDIWELYRIGQYLCEPEPAGNIWYGYFRGHVLRL